MSATSQKPNHVEAIEDLLSEFAQDDTNWTGDAPSVQFYWDVPQSEKQSMGVDLPPNIYVWSPTSAQIPQFSADGDLFQREATVEIQVWSYDPIDVREYHRDVIQLLSNYFADNAAQTEFVDIRPVNASDFREQKNPKTDSPYIMSVEVELQALDLTRQRGNENTTVFEVLFDSGFA